MAFQWLDVFLILLCVVLAPYLRAFFEALMTNPWRWINPYGDDSNNVCHKLPIHPLFQSNPSRALHEQYCYCREYWHHRFEQFIQQKNRYYSFYRAMGFDANRAMIMACFRDFWETVEGETINCDPIRDQLNEIAFAQGCSFPPDDRPISQGILRIDWTECLDDLWYTYDPNPGKSKYIQNKAHVPRQPDAPETEALDYYTYLEPASYEWAVTTLLAMETTVKDLKWTSMQKRSNVISSWLYEQETFQSTVYRWDAYDASQNLAGRLHCQVDPKIFPLYYPRDLDTGGKHSFCALEIKDNVLIVGLNDPDSDWEEYFVQMDLVENQVYQCFAATWGVQGSILEQKEQDGSAFSVQFVFGEMKAFALGFLCCYLKEQAHCQCDDPTVACIANM